MSWHPTAYQLIEENNYEQAAQFYEEAVENYPQEIANYWYLGLVYLLQEKEEEAQTTWLLAMSEGSEAEIEQWQGDLTEILDREAQRQEAKENYLLSWLIRGHLQEINPNLINNLLHLILLEIKLNRFQPELIKKLELIELLPKDLGNSVDSDLLLLTLKQVVEFLSEETVNLFKVALPFISDYTNLYITISSISHTAFQANIFKYSLQIMELLLERQPDNLNLLSDIFWLHARGNNYERAKEIAQQFIQQSETLSLKLYGNYLLVEMMLRMGAWLELNEPIQRHKNLLNDLLKNSPKNLEPLVINNLMFFTGLLFYVEDSPKQTRYYRNSIAQLFHEKIIKVVPQYKPVINIRKNRQLKIGYITRSFRRHSIGWLSRWLFQHYDKEAFQFIIYLINQPEDNITELWFRNQATLTHKCESDPIKIAQQIQDDQIDILVDLESTTFPINCQILTLKPAPIQITWLGYDASGLPTVDYFIGDPYVLPEDAQDYYQEKIWRLPNTYLAVDGFEVSVPRLRREQLNIPDNAIVYLSSQTGLKRHPETISLQMQILKQVPNSYFLVKGGDEKTVQNLFTSLAEKEGISPTKIIFLSNDPTSEIYRANLHIADVVLDTYPYNGATTTLEVLWMGIPLVTRVGQQFAARNSYTFLINAGISEGIAWTDEEYVEWGIRLGTDAKLRQHIAWKLKNSRKIAPLWNAQQFTRDMENAYRQMFISY